MKQAFKRIMALALVIAVMLGVLPSVLAANIGNFTDVKDDAWYAKYVEYVVFQDLMNGTSATTFEPNSALTRAMTATVLWRVAGEPPVYNKSTFTDLKGDWYMNAVAWAQAEKVVNGVTATTFAPDSFVTREQIVAMMWRFKGSPAVEGDYLKDFKDAAKVSAYARDAFNWAISVGIINGDNGSLKPQANATRAEFAKIIYQYAQLTKPCAHAWDEGKVTKEATCTEAGEKTFTCTKCGVTKTEPIPAKGHTYGEDGKCTVCGEQKPNPDPKPDPDPKPTNAYVLTNELKDGDEVVIYNPGYGKAIKNETDNDWYLIAQDVTPENNKITTDDATIVWTAKKNSDGTFSFVNGTNAITGWYSKNDKGEFLELTNNASYSGGSTVWNVVSANAADNTFYISNATLLGEAGAGGYIECYTKKTGIKICGFYTATPTAKDYGFQFYVKGGTAPEPGPGPEPTDDKTFELVTSDLGDWAGTYVIGYVLEDGSALIFNGQTTKDKNHAAAAVTDNKVTVSADYVVEIAAVDGGYTLKAKGGYMNGKMNDDGTIGNGLVFSETPSTATIAWTDGEPTITCAVGSIFRYNDTRENSVFRFYRPESSVTKLVALFKLVEGGDTPTPPTPPTPTGDYVLTNELKDGDEVVIYNPGYGKAIKNETDNNWYLIAQDVTPADNKITTDDTTIVWTVKKNEDGTFSFVNGTNAITGWYSKNDKGEFLELTNDANYEGGDSKWNLTAANATEKTFYISSATLTGAKGAGYMECYTKKEGVKVCGFFTGTPSEKDYGFQFFVKGGTTPTPPTPPTPGEHTEHTYGNATYAWTEAEGGYTCVGTRACTYEGCTEKLTATATVTYKDDPAATCTVDGKRVYTATFAEEGFGTDAKEVTLPKLGHNWGDDGKCTNPGCTETKPAEPSVPTNELETGITVVITTTVSKVNYELDGFYSTSKATLGRAAIFTDKVAATLPLKVVDGAEKDVNVAFQTADGKYLVWNDGNSLELSDTLNANSSWVVTFNENGTAKIINASTVAAKDAKDQRVIVFNLNNATAENVSTKARFAAYDKYADKESAPEQYGIPVLYKLTDEEKPEHTEHTYGDATYAWTEAEGGYTCVGTKACTYEGCTEKLTATATVTYKDDPAATCTADGKRVYTATFAEEGFGTDTKEVTLPKLGHNWGDDGKCTNPGCNETKPAESTGDYAIATELKVGDAVVLVATHNSKYYAVANDSTTVKNALNGLAVTVADGNLDIGTADVLWTVCAGSADGTITLKSSTGKYIVWAGSGTQLTLGDTGTNITPTCGNGTSVAYFGKDKNGNDRQIVFRLNGTVPQFRAYASSNSTGEYSQVLTFWKATK